MNAFPDEAYLSLHGFQRCSSNPLLTPSQVAPTRDDMKVVGVFNPSAIEIAGETILLARVSETFVVPDSGSENVVRVPVATPGASHASNVTEVVLSRDDNRYDFTSDTRVILSAAKPQSVKYLTSISHLRCARSRDGIHFNVDTQPFLFPACASRGSPVDDKLLLMEEWGIEDPRVVDLSSSLPSGVVPLLPQHLRQKVEAACVALGVACDEAWSVVVVYTAVSRYGAATCMAITTRAFASVVRLGIIFVPENKDVCLLPANFGTPSNPRFFCYHRPVPKSFGNPDIWFGASSDVVSWGQHQHMLGTADDVNGWDSGRVGGGAPSVLCEHGWLHVYHAADAAHRYCLGVFLADKDDPSKVIARASVPILTPAEDYETHGFFPNVVFTCGVVLRRSSSERDASLWVYYGAADDKIALAVFTLRFLFERLGLTP